VNLGADGHPSYVIPRPSRTRRSPDRAVVREGERQVPGGRLHPAQHLDEKVARLQLRKLNAKLTELTDQQPIHQRRQAGPYKSERYRY